MKLIKIDKYLVIRDIYHVNNIRTDVLVPAIFKNCIKAEEGCSRCAYLWQCNNDSDRTIICTIKRNHEDN